jgi:hypothetical protein
MSSVSVPLPTRRMRGPLLPYILLASIVVIIAMAGVSLWTASRAAQLPGTVASEAAVQEKFGIRITHIAVLADGGLIDFRFQILDPDKAAALFELESRPLLYVEATGKKVDSLYHPPHGHDFLPGQSQYFIYNNHQGAIRSGSPVAVVLGELRLEHIIAK